MGRPPSRRRAEGALKLRRYWIRFDDPGRDAFGLGLGCGVTAFDRDDAVALLEEHLFKGPMPFPIIASTEDVDIRTLDRGHGVPNMLPPNRRGIWYPIGYAASTGR